MYQMALLLAKNGIEIPDGVTMTHHRPPEEPGISDLLP
jgi:hypothetical protein